MSWLVWKKRVWLHCGELGLPILRRKQEDIQPWHFDFWSNVSSQNVSFCSLMICEQRKLEQIERRFSFPAHGIQTCQLERIDLRSASILNPEPLVFAVVEDRQ